MKLIASLLMIIGTLLAAIGQIIWKLAVQDWSIPWFILGYFVYGLFFFLMLYAYKHAEMSYVFPHLALNFVWVTIIAFIFLNEAMGWLKIVGVFSIVAGIIFAGASK